MITYVYIDMWKVWPAEMFIYTTYISNYLYLQKQDR